jgi:hypothetical protein
MLNTDKGIDEIPSNHSVDETIAKLKGILESKGATLFAVIDHSGEGGEGRAEDSGYRVADHARCAQRRD